MNPLLKKLHPYEIAVLKALDTQVALSTLVAKTKLQPNHVDRAVQMLAEKGLVETKTQVVRKIILDVNGQLYAKEGLPEIKLLKSLSEQYTPVSKLEKAAKLAKGEINIVIGTLKRKAAIEVQKGKELELKISMAGKKLLAKPTLEQLFLKKLLERKSLEADTLEATDKAALDALKQRKRLVLVQDSKTILVNLSQAGLALQPDIISFDPSVFADQLTPEMIKTGSWKNIEFRAYNVDVTASMLRGGRHHPMMEANTILKDVFIEMGFSEMTGPLVESEFWCFDALWIPQDHPARDEQDTFFLDGTAKIPKAFVPAVKRMHEQGIKRTHTLPGEFSEDVTARRILRTHSTPASFRTLAELGKKLKAGENIDGKYFYVATNFRNEAIDATHLAEFWQAEGFIIGDDLSLADLMGFIKEYYAKLGIHKIRFKPTFNPYTEPSMEAHYYDEHMGKWYALINSGIFRPETLAPFGLKGKRVLAWGMGASRVATLLANKSSMRDITGATCDFSWLQNRPAMKREIVRRVK